MGKGITVTTGALLLSLSSLASGTALEHLQAITIGSGGAGCFNFIESPISTINADMQVQEVIPTVEHTINVTITHI